AQTPALTVNFTVGGTATFSSDYTQSGAASFTAGAGTVTFGLGSSTATVTLTTVPDSTVEPDETAILTVTSGSGYSVGSPSAATGTITNDDSSAVSLVISGASSVAEGTPPASGNALVYTTPRDTTPAQTPALTVNFSVGGTATFNAIT